MNRWMLAFLLFSLPLAADDNCDEMDENDEECIRRTLRYEDQPDSSILRDPASWPSDNKDPFVESLSR